MEMILKTINLCKIVRLTETGNKRAVHIGIIAGVVLGYEGKLNANENLEQLFMDVAKSNHMEG